MEATHQSIHTNRRVKDSVFRDLFGNPERKENALSLYNAINDSSYDDPSELELTTIEGAIYMGHKNGVSFLLDDVLVLWEHQSTYNPNMPLRGLSYFASLYDKYLAKHKLNAYGTRLITLPTPRYFVFYNGSAKRQSKEILRLSDAFAYGPGDLEVTATILNINEGYNRQIMKSCDTLLGYAHLVSLIRLFGATMSLDDAIHKAVQQCIADGYLVDYLTERQAEVESMLITEFNEEATLQYLRDEARSIGLDEGLQEGMKLGRDEGLKLGRDEGLQEGLQEGLKLGNQQHLKRVASLVNSGDLTLAQAELLGFTQEDIKAAEQAQ